MGSNLHYLTGVDCLDLPVKHCSRSGRSVLNPARQERLRKALESDTIPADDQEDIKALVEAILTGDLASIKAVVTKYSCQVGRFEMVRAKLAQVIPALSDGAIEIIQSAPYRLATADNKAIDVINLTLRVTGSGYAVGVPTHPLVRTETLKMVSMAPGSGYLEPDREHDAKWVLDRLFRANSPALPPLPPAYNTGG